MVASRRRPFQIEDPTASDPDDGDYGASSPQQPKTPRRSRTTKTPNKKSQPKKKRDRYGGANDDIVDTEDDDDDDDDVDEESFAGSESSEQSEVEVNHRTGRPSRSAAKKPIKYEEPSEEDIVEEESDRPTTSRAKRGSKQKPASLIVKLKVPISRNTRSRSTRAASKSFGRGTTPEFVGTRRSSRISHDRELPLAALGESGKYAVTVRPGTRSPEPEAPQHRPLHPSQGRKGPVKHPSTIIEASQETSGPSMLDAEGEPDVGGELEKQVEPSQAVNNMEIQYETVEDPQPEEAVIQESTQEDAEGEEDSDEGPVTRSRNVRTINTVEETTEDRPRTRGALKRRAVDESSDFEPVDDDKQEEEDEAESDVHPRKRQKSSTDDSSSRRQSARLAGKTRSSQRSRHNSESEDELDQDELADEAADLELDRRERRRTRNTRREKAVYEDDQPKLRKRNQKVDYRLLRPENNIQFDDDDAAPAATPSRNRRTMVGGYRGGMLPVGGPFGGFLSNGPEAAGGADTSDSEDEIQMPTGGGGVIGLASPNAPGKKPTALAHNADSKQKGLGGGPANLGKLDKDRALSDSNPLGVDESVNFKGVGGLDDHINQLKEMVTLPLLYPELFQRFHMTPPRGVLFHGPPGTGKTLLARALANAVSSNGKKVTFYMRKGADALSKWVGEAERQLRLLFEDAQKNQPSIIFFDEIDGLAPVRSSKQEQIHASIVATLLALMDGMDDRGQVVVIGATNRPDSVDPALRRPGRFDREFYFPLPSQAARRSIIDIHTKDWNPPLQPEFKDQLADMTKGYGGADLRALCTEAALNAVQGTYPQIYGSTKKLIIDPAQIKVLAKDFMISINKIVPSSERSNNAAPAPLHKSIEPLLRMQLGNISHVIDRLIPQKKKLTALEEAEFDDRDDAFAFERANMERDFDRAKIFRPRLLIQGVQGMGQQHLGSAILHRFEGMHVQSFDLPTLLGDTAKSPEASIVELFKEVRRHKPSVIYIPNVNVWYQTVSNEVMSLFKSQLRALPANDAVLVLGMMELEHESEKLDPSMLRDLFGYSTKNIYKVQRPDEASRKEFFENVIALIRKPPTEFPDPNRKKRQLPELEEAPEPKEEEHRPTREELQNHVLSDRHVLNCLKILLQPIMDQLKLKYKKFRTGIVDEAALAYLWAELDPNYVKSDVQQERPYEWAVDKHGRQGFVDTASQKFFYNMDITYIERRLSNGFYKTPGDFQSDVWTIVRDAKSFGDTERHLKGNEMLTNVEVDIQMIKTNNPQLISDLEGVAYRDYWRGVYKAEDVKKKQKKKEAGNQVVDVSNTTDELSGPITLGEKLPEPHPLPPSTPVRRIGPSSLSNGYSTSDNTTVQRQSNGTGSITNSFQHEGDSHENDSQEQESQEHRDKRPRLDEGEAASGLDTQQRSQKSSHMQMAPNTQPGDYQNSASTTTSGQKTSDRSHRSSGPFQNSQSTTNGVTQGLHPDFASGPAQTGGSQLPDTQEVLASSQPTNSQPSQSEQQQQPHTLGGSGNGGGIPPSNQQNHTAPITDILNTAAEGAVEETGEKLQIMLDESAVAILYSELVRRSSGLSVEQLEQINAAIMDAIWEFRTDWNRNHVCKAVATAFNEVIEDIETMQAILPPSQDK
ncbi:uncharacterized protein K452DRAFT_270645 [Aplosporella prunicola CBS 121167]|uniref:AAA+ ATPase domain-containing protein n=1 Tax=Aplosporella prunicola CBS 121167 TaxID=1176127 RepID=A0A6A6BGG9_9PEZI|nr:uncharacterized protein K452DRAFT_270645 [Aplosporella prunicola CBS 121167]KAF2141967.1 hypothetical protein K452DRAFT_270645 [Aplosporella prunicola CBS 121167]